MKHSIFAVRLVVAGVLGLALNVTSCFPEPSGSLGSAGSGGDLPTASGGAATMVEDGGAAGEAGPACAPRPSVEGAECHPALSAEPLPGREVSGVPQDRTVFQSQLYAGLKSYCGGCHLAPAAAGGFSFAQGTFAVEVDQKVVDAITSNTEICDRDNAGNKLDPTCFPFMPPATTPLGKKWSKREPDPSDPLKPLVRLLKQWIATGRKDTFTDAASAGATAPYVVSAELAASLTNLGTCVPDPGMVGTEPATCDQDARFAAMAKRPDGAPAERLGLPLTLDQTDLTTFDSAELARSGVVAYLPAYPLWTDDAGKLRFVRVPMGESIRYNKQTKQFDIPANTRFYKTFMKKVKGVDGVVRYHKIETRVIVSRPRDADGNDQSLFGTYEWNDDESQADLLTDPQYDGEPFVDKVKPIITDEAIAAEVTADFKKHKIRNLSYALDSRHATRRYAFPSHARCIQCHMGSPSQSFILGFTPLQLNVRPCSPEAIAADGHCEAGQVEPALGDEVTQVERLTAYGVVSGYGEADLVKLEDPQGTKKQPRALRTTEELVAQGYMLGNCAHCHNPNGYPSVEHPELKPLLNFLPSDTGGIYGFPFERYSPRIFRNFASDGPIPYITPSLRDRFGEKLNASWKPKFVPPPKESGRDPQLIDAPWRSLIYRNVDTPFTYTDDSAIYPHMPLNSPGFDCRAPRILGEWMVSIPALQKHPELNEDVPPDAKVAPDFTELDPQPYREVKPGDPEYDNAVAQAAARLQTYRAGLRNKNYCPDTSDIVDLDVERGIVLEGVNVALIPQDGEVSGLPHDSVPDRPHWVSIDLTNPPGPWNPRRPDWKKIILAQDFSDQEPKADNDSLKAMLEAQKRVVAQLQNVSLTPSSAFWSFASTKLPFGLWQQKPACTFGAVSDRKCENGYCSKLGELKSSKNPPLWTSNASAPADSPVYSATPGSLVFNMICVNCHGPDADSSGRQAQTLAEMTGGTARVANFRDGLFGPFGGKGENRRRVFGSDEVAARYLPWMALGGTLVQIPAPILQLVANTPVLGESRRGVEVTSANMLQTAQALCRFVVPFKSGPFEPTTFTGSEAPKKLHGTNFQLITNNGDAELWEHLCAFDNPAPLHAMTVSTAGGGTLNSDPYNSYFSKNIPSGTLIGDQHGNVQTWPSADNVGPWCVIKPTEQADLEWLQKQTAADGKQLPICPESALTADNRLKIGANDANGVYVPGDFDEWAARGAINAGQAVFVYLDQMISQGKGRALRYDECEQLGN
jgi:mono/diheme cytochrome c family protein